MRAAELYRLLHGELGAWFREHGFARRRGARLAYQRQRRDLYETVWFQCDKHGWDHYAGSSFSANFSVTADPDPESVRRRDERLNAFLTDGELDIARAYRDTIVARIPKQPESYFQMLEAQFGKSVKDPVPLVAALRAQFEPEPIPYRRHQDFMLRYFQPEDVAGWAAFILPVLPRAFEQMAAWTPE